MYPWIRSIRFTKSHIIFISTVRRVNISLFDWQKAFSMVDDETMAYNDAKQLVEQNMTIDRS